MRKKIFIFAISAAAIFAVFSLATSEIEKKKKDDLYRQVELFSDSLAIIDTEYVDDTKPKDLIYGALKGMIASLDPHSAFMSPDEYNELKVETEGRFGGLGIEITVKDGLLTVVSPIEDTPAWKAGLKPNDKIVRINNELTRDMTLTDAVKKLRGKSGDPVNITILRESEKRLLEFKIVREMIKIKDIKEAKILEDSIGYIRLVEFRESTLPEFNSALEKLNREGMSALILDLRNNPGGLLEQAVDVAEKFVEKGKLIVYTKGKKASQSMDFLSRNDHPVLNLPMVVLINEGSASASEIVAGCLQDYKRAMVLGTKSFGKGSVQTLIPLSDGSALRLTTSKFYTPSGKVIHGNGVTPDIIAEGQKSEIPEEAKAKEAKPKEIFEEIEKKEKTGKKEKGFDYKNDSQLMRAVDVLKALKFYKGTKA
jgi:carboxyl-terminal processing protease